MNAPTTVLEQEVLEAADVPATGRTLQKVGTRTDSAVFFKVITAVAKDPQVDVEKMERLWAMHEKLAAHDREQAFNASMVAAQSEMGRISTNADNPQTHSRYATYGQMDKHLRPIYTRHGFSLSFDTGEGAPDGCIRVLAYVGHDGGHSRTYHADIPADGKGPRGNDVMTKTHASASAMSYGMRYLVKLIFNVAIGEDDDDGNAASAQREITGNKVLGGLLADLKAATSDEAVCQIWDTGSKALKAAGTEAELEEFGDAVATRRGELCYPAERFAELLPSWVKAVTTGKKSEADLLAFIQAKHPLSIEQKDEIRQAIAAATN